MVSLFQNLQHHYQQHCPPPRHHLHFQVSFVPCYRHIWPTLAGPCRLMALIFCSASTEGARCLLASPAGTTPAPPLGSAQEGTLFQSPGRRQSSSSVPKAGEIFSSRINHAGPVGPSCIEDTVPGTEKEEMLGKRERETWTCLL